MPFRVLIVCGGNTCRSPMAEGLLTPMAQAAGLGACQVSVGSAGASAADGEPASRNAVAVMAEIGVDIGAHRSRRLTPELIRGADLVLAMERRHLDAVRAMAPEAAYRAGMLAESDIADPYMMSVDEYRYTRDQIAQSLDKILRDLAGRGACE